MTDGSSRPSLTPSAYRRTRLVAGPPGAGPGGIEEAFVEEIRRLKKDDSLRPLSVVVGSNPLRLHLSRLLAIRLSGHANITFHLLRDLARDLGTPGLAGRGRRRLPEFGRELVLREVIRSWAAGTYFERISDREGFLDAAGSTIRDLKEAGIDPAALRATAAGLRHRGRGTASSGDALTAGKLEDIAGLFARYDDRLREKRFHDEEDLMKEAALAAVATTSGPAPAAVVYGFYDLNGLQRSLLRDWLAFREGTVFVPLEPEKQGGTVWAFARPLLAWFEEWIASREILTGVGAAGAARPGGRGGPRPEPRYLSVPGEVREVTEAVRGLARIARERSLPLGHVALLYRNAEPYLSLLPELFERAGGIPWYSAEGLPTASNQAVRALMLLFEAMHRKLDRRAVIDAMMMAGEPMASEWDRISREAGVTQGADVWETRLARVPGEAARALARRVAEMQGAFEAIPQRGTWKTFVASARGLMERFVAPEVAVGSFYDRLGGLSALDDLESPIDREGFLLALARAVATWREPAQTGAHFQRSGIFVGSVMEARLLSFDAVALLGMVEKGFPAPPRQDPILLDEEREQVNAVMGTGLLPLKAARHDEERLLFRLALSSAQESITLSWPRIDAATARPRMPSPFLLALEGDLSGGPVGFAELEKSPRMSSVRLAALAPDAPGEAIIPREFDLAVLSAAVRPLADAAARRKAVSFLHAQSFLHRALSAEEARWGERRFTAHDGVIIKSSLREALARHHPIRDRALSPSSVEEYATCPLRYFFSRVLRLEPFEDPVDIDRLDPARLGGLLHRILKETYDGLKERGWLPLNAARLSDAHDLLRVKAEAAFAREAESGPVGYALLWEIEKRQVLEDLREVIRRDIEKEPGPAWVPSWFELPIGVVSGGARGALPVVEIRSGYAVALKGRIDRVDVSSDGLSFRVIDYKSGHLPSGTELTLRGGTKVQLPLYMLAAEQTLAAAHPGIHAAEGRYVSVTRKGSFKSISYAKEALDRDAGALRDILSTVVREIEEGRFFAYPSAEACGHCAFTLACGEGREARFTRKRGDPVAAEFLAMRERGQE